MPSELGGCGADPSPHLFIRGFRRRGVGFGIESGSPRIFIRAHRDQGELEELPLPSTEIVEAHGASAHHRVNAALEDLFSERIRRRTREVDTTGEARQLVEDHVTHNTNRNLSLIVRPKTHGVLEEACEIPRADGHAIHAVGRRHDHRHTTRGEVDTTKLDSRAPLLRRRRGHDVGHGLTILFLRVVLGVTRLQWKRETPA